jgi:hypothetical protein
MTIYTLGIVIYKNYKEKRKNKITIKFADSRRRETDNVIGDSCKILYSEGNEYSLI